MLLRRHWLVLLRHVSLLAALMLVPLVIFGLLYFLDWTVDNDSPLFVAAVMAGSLYYIFIWLLELDRFVDYHLDVWIVTDQRIISIEQQGLFNHVSSEHSIYKVQDVTAEIKGKRQTFFNYGQVHIQTAAEAQRFIFEEVADPKKVARIIMETHEEVIRRQGGPQAQPASNNLISVKPERNVNPTSVQHQ